MTIGKRVSAKPVAACSMACLDNLVLGKGTPVYVNGITQQDAMQRATEATSTPAGEYLEKIGKTDLATMTVEEWHGLLSVVVNEYCNAMDALSEVPF